MKIEIFAPLAITALFLLSSSCNTYVHTQVTPTKTVTVEALGEDISYNLDLRAVATVFANSRDLQDFEYRLNDYESGISNLDLNGDGQIDYLRVVELYENGVHLAVIQAVLGHNVFQDVATVVVETRGNSKVHVQIVGDPFIYGVNYIIEPVFYQPPVIYTCFRVPYYAVWHSPYYWGHYPHYYHHRAPARPNVYVNNIHIHINNRNNYKYTNKVRNERTVSRMQTTISRSDYAKSNPRQSFNSRNNQARNSRDLQTTGSRSSSTGSRSNATVNSSRSNASRSNSTVNSSRSNSSRSNSTVNSSRSNADSRTSGTRPTATPRSSSSSSSSTSTNRQTTTQPRNSSRTNSTAGSRQNSSPSRQTETRSSAPASSGRSSGTSTRQSGSSSSRSSGTSTNTRSSGSSSSTRSSGNTGTRR